MDDQMYSLIKYAVIALGILLIGLVIIRVLRQGSSSRKSETTKFKGKFRDTWDQHRKH